MHNTAVPPPPLISLSHALQAQRRLAALLLLFLALSLVYNVSIPLFEAPDEMDHVSYAHWLAEGNGLPHLVADRSFVGEIWQPPLYYALIAAVIAPIDRSDMVTIAPLNQEWVEGGFGKLAHYHTDAEKFPYRQSSLAVHLARLVSTLLGMVTIICTYGIARRLIPRYALVAAALVALNPQFVFMSAVVNNDNLVIALCSALVWWAVWQWDRPVLPWRHYVLAGGLWGGAVLAKLTGLGLGGVLALALALTAVRAKIWRTKTWRPLWGGALCVLTAVLICGWWFGRNWQLYADPLAWQQMLEVTQGLLRPQPLSLPETLRYASFLRKSYWAMFGYGLPAPALFYWFAQAAMLAAVIGWLKLLTSRPGRVLLSPALLLIAWSAIVFMLLLRWMQQIDTTNQGRLLFPAISSLAVLMAMGLAALDGRRQWLSKTVVVLLAAWAAAMPFLVIQPAYAQPAPLAAAAAIPNPAAVQFGDSIQLLGYDAPAAVTPGEPAPLALYWQAVQPVVDSYAIAVRILDSTQRVVSSVDVLPYQGRYPTLVWPLRRPFQDSLLLPPVAADAEAGLGTLLLILYPLGRPDAPLPVMAHGNPAGNDARLAAIKINPTGAAAYAPSQPLQASFGQQIHLLGFDAVPEIVAGRPLTVTLYWQAIQPDGRDYTVFIHLLDGSDALIAQADGPPQDNRYPTSIWVAGEQIRDPRLLLLPADLPPGPYSLHVGLYDPTTGQRLAAADRAGHPYAHDSVNLLAHPVR